MPTKVKSRFLQTEGGLYGQFAKPRRAAVVWDFEPGALAATAWVKSLACDEIGIRRSVNEVGIPVSSMTLFVDEQSELSSYFGEVVKLVFINRADPSESPLLYGLADDIQSELPAVNSQQSFSQLAQVATPILPRSWQHEVLRAISAHSEVLETLKNYPSSLSRFSVIRRAASSISEATLTDPEKLLSAFDSPDLTAVDRRTLALFAEPQKFPEAERETLIKHLWKYIADQRTTSNTEELVALGAAIRKLMAYLPASRFDQVVDLLEPDGDKLVSANVELEFSKGLVYRLGWDADARKAMCTKLSDAMYELASYHSSKRASGQDASSAIAVNALMGLALLGDVRATKLAQSLPKRAMPWFVALVHSRARRLLVRLKSDDSSAEKSLGVLPDLVGNNC